jgi:hypothetical protein
MNPVGRGFILLASSIGRELCRYNPVEKAAPDRRGTGVPAAAFLRTADCQLLGRTARGGRQTDSKYATMHPGKLLRCVAIGPPRGCDVQVSHDNRDSFDG